MVQSGSFFRYGEVSFSGGFRTLEETMAVWLGVRTFL